MTKRSFFLTSASFSLSLTALVAQTEVPGQVDMPVSPAEPAVETPAVPSEETVETEVPAVDEEQKVIPRAIPVIEEPFVPQGGVAQLKEQADIDLFTVGKDIGHVQDDPTQQFRRLVQRTIMPTESVTKAGAVLTFDDYLVADSRATSSAIDIAKDLAPLNTRVIFFANVNGVSETDVKLILRKKVKDSEKKKLVQSLLDSKKEDFVKTIRELIKIQGPADEDGNQEYICEVFNHTAFHQDMSGLKLGTIQYEICLMGIDFVEECISEAYLAERPEWQRARYFRFPFLHVPKDKKTMVDLNAKFTEHGLIAVGETQDSKDFTNYSANTAYRSLAAAKKNRRYNPKFGEYGVADQPIALFHTKTWKKIKSGVIKSIKETK